MLVLLHHYASIAIMQVHLMQDYFCHRISFLQIITIYLKMTVVLEYLIIDACSII